MLGKEEEEEEEEEEEGEDDDEEEEGEGKEEEEDNQNDQPSELNGQKSPSDERLNQADVKTADKSKEHDDDRLGAQDERIALSFDDIKKLRQSLDLELGRVFASVAEDVIEEQIAEDLSGASRFQIQETIGWILVA